MRRRVVGVVLAAVVAGTSAHHATTEASAAGGALPACAVGKPIPGAEIALTRQINIERRRQGLRPLRRIIGLVRNARGHNRWMSRTRRFAHPPAGIGFGGARPASQNLAFMGNARAAFLGFMASPPHRRNILAPRWRFVGVGAARCGGGLLFTVNVLA